MKWIAIKTKNLPIIALQIDRAIEVFESLAARLSITHKREDESQLMELRAQFENRIGQLDSFYKQHCLDDSISIFHMLKVKMKRTIFRVHPRMEETSRFTELSFRNDNDELFPENQIKILEQPLFTYYESTFQKSNSQSKKEGSLSKTGSKASKKVGSEIEKTGKVTDKEKNAKNSRPIVTQNVAKKKVGSPVKEATSVKTEHYGNKGGEREEKIGVGSRLPFKSNASQSVVNKTKKSSRVALTKAATKQVSTPSFESQSMNEVQQNDERESELKFTIKMTRQQYRLLLQMKKKLQKQGKL